MSVLCSAIHKNADEIVDGSFEQQVRPVKNPDATNKKKLVVLVIARVFMIVIEIVLVIFWLADIVTA